MGLNNLGLGININVKENAKKVFGGMSKGFSKFTSHLPKGMQGITGIISKLGPYAAAIGIAVGAVLLLNSAIQASVKVSKEWETGMSVVTTLFDNHLDPAIGKLEQDILGMSVATGATFKDLQDGAYQVVSAFGAAADTSGILEVSVKAAKAGMASTTDAVNLLSAVTKGYGDTSIEAVNKVSDLSFMTVKLGQTDFPALAASMGKVVPLASAMKVSQEELFGAMATLTGVTGKAAEVSTQLRGTIQGFMKPSAQMKASLEGLGFASGAALLEQEGLRGSLNLLMGSVNGNTTEFANLFGSVEAGAAVLALTGGQAENFEQKIAAMGNASGATSQAFSAFTDDLQFMQDQTRQSSEVMKKKFGDIFIPFFKVWERVKRFFFETITTMIGDFVTLFINPIIAIFKPFAIIIGAAIFAIAKSFIFLSRVFFFIKGVIFNFILLPFTILSKFMMHVIGLIVNTFNKAKDVFMTLKKPIMEMADIFIMMKDAIFSVFDFGGVGGGIANFFKDVIKTPFDWMLSFLGWVVTGVERLVKSIVSVIMMLPKFIGKIVSGVLVTFAGLNLGLDKTINAALFAKDLVTKGFGGAKAALSIRNEESGKRFDTAVSQAKNTGQGITDKIQKAFDASLKKRAEEETAKKLQDGPAPVMVTNGSELADENAKKLKDKKDQNFEERYLTRNFIPIR